MKFLYQTFNIARHSYFHLALRDWRLEFELLAAHPSIFEYASRHAAVIKVYVDIWIIDIGLVLVPLVDVEVAHCVTWFRIDFLEEGHGALSHGVFALSTARALFAHHWAMEALSKGSPEVAGTCWRLRPPIKVFNLFKVVARSLHNSRLTLDWSHQLFVLFRFLIDLFYLVCIQYS